MRYLITTLRTEKRRYVIDAETQDEAEGLACSADLDPVDVRVEDETVQRVYEQTKEDL